MRQYSFGARAQRAAPVCNNNWRPCSLRSSSRGTLRCVAQQQQSWPAAPAAPAALVDAGPKPSSWAAAPPEPPSPPPPAQQPQKQPAAPVPARSGLPAAPRAGGAGDVWIPISGPPSDAAPELRRMQHPADAPDAAPASIVEVATPQQLAIGKREAREQAVALAAASAEITKWRAIAEDAEEGKRVLAARTRELEVQRDQSMAINQELLTGYKRMKAQLADQTQRAEEYDRQLTGMRAQLLGLRDWVGDKLGSAPAAAAAAKAGGVPDGDLAAINLQQLAQMSSQMARDAARDDERREKLKSELDGGGAADNNGAATAPAPAPAPGVEDGGGTAAAGAPKGVAAGAASEAA